MILHLFKIISLKFFELKIKIILKITNKINNVVFGSNI